MFESTRIGCVVSIMFRYGGCKQNWCVRVDDGWCDACARLRVCLEEGALLPEIGILPPKEHTRYTLMMHSLCPLMMMVDWCGWFC